MSILKTSFGALALFLTALTTSAQVSPYNTVLRISVADFVPFHIHINPNSQVIATLAQDKLGNRAAILRVFSKINGSQIGSPLVIPSILTTTPEEIMASTVFAPGHLLVLDSARRVHNFTLDFRTDGTPFLVGSPTIIGPFAGRGAVTALGEAPNPAMPNAPFLGIGTALGELISYGGFGGGVDDFVGIVVNQEGITDLGAISQVGYFAFGAVAGGKLFLVEPDANPFMAGLQPVLRSTLVDPLSASLSAPLIDFGSAPLTRTSLPLAVASPVSIVTAYGANQTGTMAVPAGPLMFDSLSLRSVQLVSSPVKQVVLSSLSWLLADGSGVLYDKNFTLETGIVGRLWTIAGASMVLEPQTLNASGRSQWITARIEAENQDAAEINLKTLVFSVDGVKGSIKGGVRSATRLEDIDGDTNLDLEVRFQSALLKWLLRQTTGNTAIVRASWLYADGTEGTASAEVDVIR